MRTQSASRISRASSIYESARRELARRSLLAFTEYTFPGYQVGWVHRDICRRLDRFLADVQAGRSPRLALFMPPRHGKSELASRRFPAFALGQDPDLQIILTSYGADLATLMNGDITSIIDSDLYGSIFPNTILGGKGSTKKKREDFIQTVGHSGQVKAAGVGGSITGIGANIFIIDDPVKNMEEADSPTYREKTWDWYRSTARTRLQPGGGVLLIQTRWNEDDLGGRLLEDGENTWEIARYPAISEPDDQEPGSPAWKKRLQVDKENRDIGDPLHPERFSKEELEQTKREVGSRVWCSLYQQDPRAREGGLFRREWFDIVEKIPLTKGLRTVRYWDRAGTDPKTEGGDPAFTTGVKLTYDSASGIFYIEDIRRFQKRPRGVRDAIRATASQDGASVHIGIEQEPGSSGKESIEIMISELAGYVVRADRPTGSKETRAEPVSAQAEIRNIKLLRGSWNRAFLDEAEGFGAGGKYKDQADALSGAFAMLVGSKYDIYRLIH